MKRFVRFVAIAVVGLSISFGIQTLLPVAAQHSPLELVQKGKEYYDRGKFAIAATTLEEAAKLYGAAGATLEQAQALSWMSLAEQKIGRWQDADKTIRSSLDILETLPPGDKLERVRAQVLNAGGYLELAKGNAEGALDRWQEAETLYTKVGDRLGATGSQIDRALAMQSLGLYRRAEQLLTEVEGELNKLPDSSLKATGLQNLANALRQAGDLENSRKILQLSLAVAERLQSNQDISTALINLGNAELALFKKTKAESLKDNLQDLALVQEAFTHYQQAADIATSPLTKIQAQLNQLSLAIETNQITSIQALLPSIRETLPQLPASRASVYAYANFAQNAIERNLPVEKRELERLLATAANQARELEDDRAESYALGILGKVYEKNANWSQAQKLTESALIISQSIDAPDITYQWQWQMGRILQNRSQMQRQDRKANPQAIAYYSQAVKLLNNLRGDLIILNPEVQFSFRDSVEPVYRQLVDLLLRSENPTKNNLIQARNVIEALQLAELDNFFRDACAKPKKVNIDDLDPHAAVIYPIILKDRLEVILKLPGSDNLRHYVNKAISETEVDKAVQNLQQAFIKRSTSLNRLKTEAKPLYSWLIEPFQAELESSLQREQSQIKTLVFVLDGSLRNVPMSALYDEQRYLIERYAIAVTPSLQLLEPKPLRRESLNALVAGASDAPSFKQEGFGSIENVNKELTGIEREVKDTRALQEQKFLKENIQNQIKSNSYTIVHLATHGQFSSNTDRTFILDWDKRIRVKDLDDLLRSNNQKTVKPIELLVLSACETAAGDKRAALGLAGVAIRAGARSTIGTLWNVNDASTASFMTEFYQQLNDPQMTKAEALRNTQLAFIKNFPNTDYNRPYHWASFILVGNWL